MCLAPQVKLHRRVYHHQGLTKGQVQLRLRAQQQHPQLPDWQNLRCSIIWTNGNGFYTMRCQSNRSYRWPLTQPAAWDHKGCCQHKRQALGQSRSLVPCLLARHISLSGNQRLGHFADAHPWMCILKRLETGGRRLPQGRGPCDWCQVPGARARSWSCGTSRSGLLQGSSGMRAP